MKIIIVCAVVSCLLLEVQGGIAPDRAKRQAPYNTAEYRYGQQMQASPFSQYPPQQIPPQRYPPQQYPPQQYPPQQYPAINNRGNPGVPPNYNGGSRHIGVIDVDAPPNTSSGYPQYHSDGSRHIGFIDVDGPAGGTGPARGAGPVGGAGPYYPNTGMYPAGNQGINPGMNRNIQFPGGYRGTFYPGNSYPG